MEMTIEQLETEIKAMLGELDDLRDYISKGDMIEDFEAFREGKHVP